MTVWECIQRGEYVMIALAVILVGCIVIWWVRGASLRKERKSYRILMQRVRDQITEGDLENARQLCRADAHSGGRMLEAGINRIGRRMDEVENGLRNEAEVEKQRFSRGARWLKTFATISPLLGFGGTLVGLTDRLRDMGEASTPVDLALICSQTAPAIVTTVAGLTTGIFALVAFAFLEASIDKSKRSLDELANDFSDLLNEPS